MRDKRIVSYISVVLAYDTRCVIFDFHLFMINHCWEKKKLIQAMSFRGEPDKLQNNIDTLASSISPPETADIIITNVHQAKVFFLSSSTLFFVFVFHSFSPFIVFSNCIMIRVWNGIVYSFRTTFSTMYNMSLFPFSLTYVLRHLNYFL